MNNQNETRVSDEDSPPTGRYVELTALVGVVYQLILELNHPFVKRKILDNSGLLGKYVF